MTYIDQAVLNLTERLCRLFQVWTGRTNVWLAFQLTNLSVIVYFVWVGTLYWVSGDLVVRVFLALFCGGVLWVLSRTIFRASIDLSETQAYTGRKGRIRAASATRNCGSHSSRCRSCLLPALAAYTTLHLRFTC
jgi:uncharacterized membrane protein YqjE